MAHYQTINTDWPWPRVKMELELRGHTLRSVAVAEGMARSTLMRASEHQAPRAQAAIASRIGVLPQNIWPSRYRSDSTPVPWSEWMRRFNPEKYVRHHGRSRRSA